MSVAFMMDVHVPRAVTMALRLRGIDILTAQEDYADRLDDKDPLLRAAQLERVLVSQDDDLLREGTEFQRANRDFCGIMYGHQLHVTIGRWSRIWN